MCVPSRSARMPIFVDLNFGFLVAFKVYDVDRDGYISNGELFLVLKMMVGNNLKVAFLSLHPRVPPVMMGVLDGPNISFLSNRQARRFVNFQERSDLSSRTNNYSRSWIKQ